MGEYKNFAQIIVVFRLENQNSSRYADEIYKHFSRDVLNPYEAGIEIPTYFINTFDYEISNLFEQAEKSIVITLIDEEMFFDSNWKLYIDFLINENTIKEQIYFLPIGLFENAQNITTNASKINFLKMTEQSPDIYKLIFILAFRILKILRAKNKLDEETVDVSLFLSHEKKYGTQYAKRIKDNINLVNLKTFLDENNIETGKDFSITIEKAIIDCSTFLVIQTDLYSSREWCLREVLQAKKNSKTIVVLDFLDEGEKRSFPYLGNSKVIKFKDNIIYLKMYSEILKETIRQVFFENNTKKILDSFEISEEEYMVLNYPPEVITLIDHKKNINKTLVYPDPKIGYEENELLKLASKKIDIQPRSHFIVMSKKLKSNLKNMKIGFSISENETIDKHLDMKYKFMGLFIDISRYLMISESTILYAGNVTYNKDTNFSEILYDFANGYNYKTNSEETRAVQYMLDLYFDSKVKKIIAKYTPTINIHIVKSIQKNDVAEDLMRSINFSVLRNEEIKEMNCLIVMGGKTKGYVGVLPGVLEEFLIAAHLKKPIYLIGGFGGVSKIISDVINHNIDFETFVKSLNISEDFVKRYNELDFVEKIDLNSIYNLIFQYKFMNKVDSEDNKTLMGTNNVDIIQSILFMGLCGLNKSKS